jgi:hypothetical protein
MDLILDFVIWFCWLIWESPRYLGYILIPMLIATVILDRFVRRA